MTTNRRGQGAGNGAAAVWIECVIAFSLLLGAVSSRGAETNTWLTPEQFFEGGTNAYTNWIELSAGGLLTSGDNAQAQQRQHFASGAFGGIEDLHFQENVDKKT